MNKTYKFITALALAAVFGTAAADNFNKTVDLTVIGNGSFSTGFSATHTEQGAFTDTYTFLFKNSSQAHWALDSQLYDVKFISQASTTGSVANNVLAFYGMTVQAESRADAVPAGGATSSSSLSFDAIQYTQASWFNDGLRQGLVLTISGYAGVDAVGAIAASYNGTFNGAITPVPEPAPAAMLLAGLAAVGMLVRRRSNTSSSR